MEKEILEKLTAIESRLDKLENKHKGPNVNSVNVGTMSYCGKYESPDGEIGANFSGDVAISRILKISSKKIAQVVDAFSSEDRLDIVKLLLKKPLTAKDIMEILNFPTTGKVYHHLSFLEKLGIIKKDNEKYSIFGKYISCVLFMILGASQIIEEGE